MGLADLLWPQVAGVGFKLDKVLKTLYIRNRIVGHGEEDPASFVANPRNWRIHSRGQADALGAALAEVGWVQSVIVNRRSGFLINGHLRVLEAGRTGRPAAARRIAHPRQGLRRIPWLGDDDGRRRADGQGVPGRRDRAALLLGQS